MDDPGSKPVDPDWPDDDGDDDEPDDDDERLEQKTRLCPKCRGLGRDASGVKCQRCGGKGRIRIDDIRPEDTSGRRKSSIYGYLQNDEE